MTRKTATQPPEDTAHECEWKDTAAQLEAKFNEASKRIAELERMFARRSEKTKKMPPIQRPSRTTAQAQELRAENAKALQEAMEVTASTVSVDAKDKRCAHCNDKTFRAVGQGKSCETIHYVHAHFRKHITKRETCVCRCGKTLVTAAAPDRWSEKTQYAPSFVAFLVSQKCISSMPIYRTEKMLAQMGLPIARSTMNELLYRAAAKLEPLRKVLMHALRQDALVQIDETSFKLTTQKKKAQMWAFVGQTLTGYVFDLTRAGTVPTSYLAKSKGAFLADDYSGYNPLADLGKRIRCGCMAHARRGFFEAGDVPEAKHALALVQEIYRVEHDALARGVVGTKEHLAMRNAQSMPFFVQLVLAARKTRKQHGPKTLLGKAAHYLCSNVPTLKRFLYDATIPPDNNRAENALRIIALARKNFLFVHSKQAGEALALLYSLTASCARAAVNPLDYLEDVLTRIDDTKVANLRNLLPDRWTKNNGPAP